MKTTTSDLLKRMYDIAIANDPKQTCLITVCRHLRELGYEVEEPENAPGDLRFAEPLYREATRANIPPGWVPCSPAWLKAGGNCSTAPRIWCEEDQNHYHPVVKPE